MMYVLPSRDTVIFPGVRGAIFVGRPATLKALELTAMQSGKNLIFVAAQRDAEVNTPDPADLYDVGTVCEMLQMIHMPDGSMKLLLEGTVRMRARTYSVEENGVISADLVPPDVVPVDRDDEKIVALREEVLRTFSEYTSMHPQISDEIARYAGTLKDTGLLADTIASHMTIDCGKKQAVLERFDLAERLELLLKYLFEQLDLLKIAMKINLKVKGELDKHQREYFLREQLKAIHEELDECSSPEAAELQKRYEKTELPENVAAKVEEELKRLNRTSPMSPEAGVIRTYIEWILDLPWKKSCEEKIDLERAEKVLDKHHYGLRKVKDRLIEYLAVKHLAKENMKAQIVCLVGPPGVGKTSLGRSIAEALNRPFVSFSLGGMRDEAEIRGHRRTYIGAMPGRILQKLKEAGVNNPVMLLDEIDKIGSDVRGDPSNALLEALDPEQNSHFTDHYLELAFDLSGVLFITTANVLHTIPGPLRDRMDIIELPGYLPEEKYHIATGHLLPRAYEESGLTKKNVSLTPAAVKRVISDYTLEAGVRNLGRCFSKIFRKVARGVLSAIEAGKTPEKLSIGVNELAEYLGAPRRPDVRLPGRGDSGLAVGLAWTAAGGDVLIIEAVKMRGKGELKLTGNLGKVMQESAQTALSFVKSHWSSMTAQKEPDWEKIALHIHVPEGAIPKDGPSAGITMAIAIFSCLSGASYRPGHAMTGEISLRGDVLPIGGLREKTLAAKRFGITKLFVPEANRPDVEDMEDWIKEDVDYIFVSKAPEVFRRVLTGGKLK